MIFGDPCDKFHSQSHPTVSSKGSEKPCRCKYGTWVSRKSSRVELLHLLVLVLSLVECSWLGSRAFAPRL